MLLCFHWLPCLAYNLEDITCPSSSIYCITYWLTPWKPDSTLSLQDCKEIYTTERKLVGDIIFTCRASYLWNRRLVLVNDSDQTVFKSTLESWNQHSLQPAACALLSSPADSARIVGWLNVISGYAVECVGTHRQWYIVHMCNQNSVHSPRVFLSCKLVFAAVAIVLCLTFVCLCWYFYGVFLITCHGKMFTFNIIHSSPWIITVLLNELLGDPSLSPVTQ